MKRIITTLLFALFALGANAQQDFLMYGLQGIPQSGYNNPSNRFEGKFYLGLPASSNYFSYTNSGFRYSEAIVPSGDSLLLDFDELISNIDDENYLAFSTSIDLLSFGFSIGPKTQINVNITEKVDFRFNYPKDFMVLIHEGNTAFGAEEANFDDIGIGLNHYREYGLGVSHQFNDKLRLGLRGKYLYGMENIYSKKTDISLQTDPNTYEITTKTDITLHTAGFDQVDDDESIGDYLMGRKNQGFGVDFGGNYQLNNKWSFNASVIDFGYIRWNSYTKTYKNDGGEYSYNGIAVDAFSNNDTSQSETSFDRVLDSLEEELGLVESTEAYTSPLTTRVYLGANYEISERDFAGVLVQTEIFQNTIKPSFTLSYNRKMTKWITLSTSYSVINNAYDNIGFGAIFDPGPFQFYLVSDNLMGAFQPQHAKHLQVRFGMNLIFGRNKTKKIRSPYTPKNDAFEPMNDSLPIASPADSTIAPAMQAIDSTATDSIPTDSLNSLVPVMDSSAVDSVAIDSMAVDSMAVDSSMQQVVLPSDSMSTDSAIIENPSTEAVNDSSDASSISPAEGTEGETIAPAEEPGAEGKNPEAENQEEVPETESNDAAEKPNEAASENKESGSDATPQESKPDPEKE